MSASDNSMIWWLQLSDFCCHVNIGSVRSTCYFCIGCLACPAQKLTCPVLGAVLLFQIHYSDILIELWRLWRLMFLILLLLVCALSHGHWWSWWDVSVWNADVEPGCAHAAVFRPTLLCQTEHVCHNMSLFSLIEKSLLRLNEGEKFISPVIKA